MTWLRHRWLPLLILVAATATLIGSIAVTASRDGGGWPAGMGMMGPAVRGDGPVRSLDDAQRAADRFGQRYGLHAGEVMQFDNGFYAELRDPAGNGATEVLIDPSGAVGWEYGPAMMWNTAYGMHRARGRADAAPISPQQAHLSAQAWLADHRPAEQAGEAEAFPGYYTLHTMRDGKITGMLSVHATTGAVWYHTWHGQFIDMRELAE
jgi:hypothetical protein